jgi:hypothetical protein
MLEQEITVSQKLLVKFASIDEYKEEYAEVIPQINKEKHPIVHRYISMKLSQIKDELI